MSRESVHIGSKQRKHTSNAACGMWCDPVGISFLQPENWTRKSFLGKVIILGFERLVEFARKTW